VILEGDKPAGYADLEVFVAPAPVPGETLYVRRQRDVAVAQRAQAEAWEKLLRGPDGMTSCLEEVMGLPLGDFARSNPRLTEDVGSRIPEGITQVRSAPPPRPVNYWAVSERFQGIERARLVVVNVRDPAERPGSRAVAGRPGAAAQGRRAVQRYRWFARQPLADNGGGGESRRSSRRRAKKAVARVRPTIRSQLQ
jgi:hypothetical protein